MLDLAGYVATELLHQGRSNLVWRGRELHTGRPLIFKTARTAYLSASERLRQEFTLLTDWTAAAPRAQPQVVQPHALRESRDQPVLIFEDIGAHALRAMLARGPVALDAFFPIAIQLVDALAAVHQGGLVHRDVNPANIVVNETTGQVQLIDFGLATKLSREHPEAKPPEQLHGTLAYLAPEQCGRMNRSVDYRADFYALGITFYEMLCGCLPFEASDALEWVHCHVAGRWQPLADRLPAFPRTLSDLVDRLIAKVAEDRYQSAIGLRDDLSECQRQWAAQRRIGAFALGRTDISDRFQLSERLYGREYELDALVKAFERVRSAGRPELFLVTGAPGIGKSALVAELQRLVAGRRGYFASGKFDQMQRGVPYSAFASALRSLLQQLLSEPQGRLLRWRERIQRAVGEYGQLLVDLVPQLQIVLGPQAPVPKLPTEQARHRLRAVVQRFMAAVAGGDEALLLFLDDLQWIDAASLELLDPVLSHRDPARRQLLVLGAYRQNEVWDAHPLRLVLGDLHKSGLAITTTALAPLAEHHVARMLEETLRMEAAAVQPLASLVHIKTRGNPYFVAQFLRALYCDGLLRFDAGARRWVWDVEAIQARNFTDNVLEFVHAEVRRLPPATQRAVSLAGFLGNRFAATTLGKMLDEEPAQATAQLLPALEIGLLGREGTRFRFLHDRGQEAAVALTPQERHAQTHLRIGRLLCSSSLRNVRDGLLFEVAEHLNQARSEITDPQERLDLAALNLRAATRARHAAAYALASQLLAAGAELLPAEAWERHYRLAHDMSCLRAECVYLSGDPALALQLLEEAMARSRDSTDRVRAALLTFEIVWTYDILAARDLGLKTLAELGFAIPAQPTREEAEQAQAAVDRLLGSDPLGRLRALPQARDGQTAVTFELITGCFLFSYVLSPPLSVMLACAAVQLAVRDGVAPAWPICLGYYAFGLHAYFGRFGLAGALSTLAREQADARDMPYRRGVVHYLELATQAWLQPIRAELPAWQRTYGALAEAGDLNMAGIAMIGSVSWTIRAGTPLGQSLQAAEACLAFTRDKRVPTMPVARVDVQRLRLLLGQTRSTSDLGDDRFDERAFLERARNWSAIHVFSFQAARVMALSLMGHHELAEKAAREADPIAWSRQGTAAEFDYHFYGGVSRAACCRAMAGEEQARCREQLRVHAAKLRGWADAHPGEFAGPAALLAAEQARLAGDLSAAVAEYERAIASMRASGFVQGQALAHERAADCFRAMGARTGALAHLHEAWNCYARWGAVAKLRALLEHFPDLHTDRLVSLSPDAALPAAAPDPPAGDSAWSTSGLDSLASTAGALDALALAKAGRAISGEIEHVGLARTLMQVVLQQSGAEEGLLLLAEGETLQLAATASMSTATVEVELPTPRAPLPSQAPLSVLDLVLRGKAPVLLSDLRSEHALAGDPYFREHPAHSVVGLPVLREGRVVAVLVLQHSASNAFSPGRVTVLEQLAAQAAISLENAQLVEQLQAHRSELEQRVEERTAELNRSTATLRDMVAGLESFNRSVSHDLRGPLAGIAGLSKLISKDVLAGETERAVQRLALLEQQAMQSTELVTALLKLAHASDAPLQRATVSTTELVGSVVAELRARDPSAAVDVAIEPMPDVSADAALLRAVYTNLISNACKFLAGRPNPRVVVGCENEDGQTVFFVKDNGPGFDETVAGRMFKPFQRFHGRDFAGHGVGLSIARRATERHGGRIWARGVPGEGASFYFTLGPEARAA
jgi:predicted ATPase/signal transduction histidine kinase